MAAVDEDEPLVGVDDNDVCERVDEGDVREELVQLHTRIHLRIHKVLRQLRDVPKRLGALKHKRRLRHESDE